MQKFKVGQTVEVIGPQNRLDSVAATGIIGKYYIISAIDNNEFPAYHLEGSNWHSEHFLRSVGIYLGGE